jgi:hypothetical protein
MKNIHNLVTDAFANMGLNESDYIVSVTYLYNRDIDVSIRLKNATNATVNLANLYLTMTGSRLLDYQEDNNLFNNDNWNLFCLTFERQIG